MLVLGLNGSPRRKGNTRFLMDTFMAEAARYGVRTRTLVVDRRNVVPCKEYLLCETKGTCPIDDDMAQEIYGLIREAEVVVAGSPIFFYNMSAQLKALVDRCQLFWARKYRMKLRDPLAETRQGFLLGVGATKGKRLFDPMVLTTKYFYDAISARYAGELVYRGMEGATALKKTSGVAEDVAKAVKTLIAPLAHRRRVLFVSRHDDCCGQLAAAWTQKLLGAQVMAVSAGIEPADAIAPAVVATMAQRGIDLEFRRPRNVAAVLTDFPPEAVVTIGVKESAIKVAGASVVEWNLALPDLDDAGKVAAYRDTIEKKVVKLGRDF